MPQVGCRSQHSPYRTVSTGPTVIHGETKPTSFCHYCERRGSSVWLGAAVVLNNRARGLKHLIFLCFHAFMKKPNVRPKPRSTTAENPFPTPKTLKLAPHCCTSTWKVPITTGATPKRINSEERNSRRRCCASSISEWGQKTCPARLLLTTSSLQTQLKTHAIAGVHLH